MAQVLFINTCKSKRCINNSRFILKTLAFLLQYTPLYVAVLLGHREISEFLIENGGDVNAGSDDEVIFFINGCSIKITKYRNSVAVNALPQSYYCAL